MSESNINQNTGKPGDEIDIFEFCSRIWKVFINFLIGIKNLFISIIIFLIRKSLWITTFALAGILLGYLLYGFFRTSYSSWMEGNTGGLDNMVVIDHVNRLSQLSNKPELLAKYLDIEEEQARAIGNIKAYYGIALIYAQKDKDKKKPDYTDFKETYSPKDTNQIRLPGYIYIKVTVFDENILPVLRKSILQYVNSSHYLQELFKISRRQKEKLISDIQTEINKIDSLQRSRFRKGEKADNMQMLYMSNEPGLQLFYNDIMHLYERKQKLEQELEISDEIITIVQDFMPLSEEETPVIKYMLILGGAMAILGIFCALLWQYRKRIWALIREDSTNM